MRTGGWELTHPTFLGVRDLGVRENLSGARTIVLVMVPAESGWPTQIR